MKRRALATVLAASMLMTACGGSTPQDEGKKADAPARVPVENYVPTYPIVEEPITVTGLVVGRDLSVSEDRLVWEKVEEVTGINIEWINIDAESLSTYLAGNDWPDFLHTDELTSSQVADYGVVGGRFVNYLDYLDIMPNLAQTYKDYPEALATSTQLNGEVYNLFQVGGPTSTGTTTRPHVRMDVLAAAGITEMPKTVDEFYNQLVTLKEKNGDPSLILDKRFDTGMLPMLFAAF